MIWLVGEKSARCDVGLEPEALTHRRHAGVGRRPGLVARRPDVGLLGELGGEAQRVWNDAGGDLLVAHQPGQDRQPGRVGRGPPVRPQGM